MSINYQEYIDGDETFIDKNNQQIISEIKNIFKDYSEINICAKGPSVKYSNDPNSIGINQGLIFSQKRFLFSNDFESFFGIEHLLKDVEYVFIPADIHTRIVANPNFTYKHAIDYFCKFNISCKFFIYRLHNRNHKYFFPSSSSTDIAWSFFRKFIGITKHNTLGHGDNPRHSYHKDLKLLDYDQGIPESSETVNNLRQAYIKRVINTFQFQ